MRTLLGELSASADYVGVMTFPGVKTTSQAARMYDCSTGTNAAVQAYKSNPVYQIIGLSHDYQTSGSSTLDTSSSIVRAAGGGGSGCSSGMSAVGGVGTYYSDAVTAAQTDLASNGRSGVQKVIILLSDGDASASSTYMTSAKRYDQCQQAVDAAQTAKTAGTRIFTIAYGASTSSSGSCGTDTPHISACSTLSQIASSAGDFYSDEAANCRSDAHRGLTDVVSIFGSIGQQMMAPRLLPDSTS
jgi:hypothetical protein